MLRHLFLLTATTFLCGCSYHFGNDVDAYDLMSRPVGNKKFEIVAPDDSIQSRMFAARFASGLTGIGFNISNHLPDYILRFSYSKTRENMQYSEQLVTGITGYVVEKKTTKKINTGRLRRTMTINPSAGSWGQRRYHRGISGAALMWKSTLRERGTTGS